MTGPRAVLARFGSWPACWSILVALVMAVTGSVRAAVVCPGFNEIPTGARDYFVLFFPLPQLSKADRDELLDMVDVMLGDLSTRIDRELPAEQRLLPRLVLCSHTIDRDDFSHSEVARYFDRRAVGAFWVGRRDGRDGLFHLATPLFLKDKEGPRRAYEVLVPADPQQLVDAQGWSRLLRLGEGTDRARSTLLPFVSMALGKLYHDSGRLRAAWLAYCDSRQGLAALLRGTPEFKQEAVGQHIDSGLKAMMAEVEARLSSAGVTGLGPCTLPAADAPR